MKNNNGEGSSSSSRLNNPLFFKVIVPDLYERLRIPTAFNKHFTHRSLSSGRAVLEGPSGNCWHVKIKRTRDGGMYLEDGWKTFIKDHSLQKYDFLIFRYDGDMQFNVRIFDKSACQRKDVFDTKPSQESGFCEGRNLCECGSPPRGLKKANCDATNKNSSDPNHFSPRSQGQLPSSSRRSMRIGETEAMEAAPYFRSDYPFFNTILKISNVAKPLNLTIPIKFARDHLPRRDTDLWLQTEAGEWKVHSYVRPSQYQYAFCGGWHKFVYGNDLKKGDCCVFELISDQVMKVYIERC